MTNSITGWFILITCFWCVQPKNVCLFWTMTYLSLCCSQSVVAQDHSSDWSCKSILWFDVFSAKPWKNKLCRGLTIWMTILHHTEWNESRCSPSFQHAIGLNFLNGVDWSLLISWMLNERRSAGLRAGTQLQLLHKKILKMAGKCAALKVWNGTEINAYSQTAREVRADCTNQKQSSLHMA